MEARGTGVASGSLADLRYCTGAVAGSMCPSPPANGSGCSPRRPPGRAARRDDHEEARGSLGEEGEVPTASSPCATSPTRLAKLPAAPSDTQAGAERLPGTPKTNRLSLDWLLSAAGSHDGQTTLTMTSATSSC